METKKVQKPKKTLSKKTVDTILEVETAAKELLRKKIIQRYNEISQTQFLLELDQCLTDEELDASDLDTSSEDMTEEESDYTDELPNGEE